MWYNNSSDAESSARSAIGMGNNLETANATGSRLRSYARLFRDQPYIYTPDVSEEDTFEEASSDSISTEEQLSDSVPGINISRAETNAAASEAQRPLDTWRSPSPATQLVEAVAMTPQSSVAATMPTQSAGLGTAPRAQPTAEKPVAHVIPRQRPLNPSWPNTTVPPYHEMRQALDYARQQLYPQSMTSQELIPGPIFPVPFNPNTELVRIQARLSNVIEMLCHVSDSSTTQADRDQITYRLHNLYVVAIDMNASLMAALIAHRNAQVEQTNTTAAVRANSQTNNAQHAATTNQPREIIRITMANQAAAAWPAAGATNAHFITVAQNVNRPLPAQAALGAHFAERTGWTPAPSFTAFRLQQAALERRAAMGLPIHSEHGRHYDNSTQQTQNNHSQTSLSSSSSHTQTSAPQYWTRAVQGNNINTTNN